MYSTAAKVGGPWGTPGAVGGRHKRRGASPAAHVPRAWCLRWDGCAVGTATPASVVCLPFSEENLNSAASAVVKKRGIKHAVSNR